MNQYEFTLKFQYPHEEEVQVATVENCLYENGCDDALVGLGRHGRIALQFNRGGKSAEEVIQRAIEDVLRALPDAQLIEAGPDCVGFTEIADILGCSRQNVRKLSETHAKTFPLPFHDGSSSLWHLSDVLDWLSTNQSRKVSSDLREVSRATMRINIAREARRLAS